jgi:hypothetical protein
VDPPFKRHRPVRTERRVGLDLTFQIHPYLFSPTVTPREGHFSRLKSQTKGNKIFLQVEGVVTNRQFWFMDNLFFRKGAIKNNLGKRDGVTN